MIFHYAGKYSGDEADLPRREHAPGAVPFKEPQDMKTLALVVNGIAIVLTILPLGLLWLRAGHFVGNFTGILLALAAGIPHEFLHAVGFQKDVYMYTNLKHGMMFVVGPEDMSRSRFVWMSLLPNILFGLIPFLLFMVNPGWEILGTLGAVSIGAGAGDYLNVFNALTQMPNTAKTYMNGMHSYWYES